MGNRLSRIYTRTGDKGTTGLADGSRVGKDDLRVECMGAVDELNSALGLALSHPLPSPLGEILSPIQHRLFDIGAELSMPEYSATRSEDITQLEQGLDALNEELPPLKEFVLPGGTPAAAYCHIARATCRRAERVLVALNKRDSGINPESLRYLNRLSDLLFVAARYAARSGGNQEVLWQPRPM
ncbi:ATP:cob(I)alamin adenosyltransferase [Alkalilimnicola ehrlichii]|uniref:Corrinoid adenosyltransferase n=1 Tax=Alkalilimnicola ehrlichii TaxID=351052 RepID=A0A3E0X373_9GAMM|nr:cob(I)yrinic acid a,c-diamide adenosyltransferase [Alkalilimnicola ehrlichii]RFA31457.1 ATP:cob(I)alamin adenosyltransferase [Alkalilimnicola ehrlichii]RFA39272.1 ATP:cob(I)alamin adenosyltransferase [Alkalilimnicola ehrlichii]